MMAGRKRRIAVVGGGNVAHHLIKALEGKAYVVLVNSRALDFQPEDYDVILIAVSDRGIEDVASRIAPSGTLVAHTSGSIGLDALSPYHDKCGVMYPLQTFTKDVEIDYSEIPFFIEATDESSVEMLKETAGLIGEKIYEADSDRRRKLHLASVFASNFANHMYASAWRIMEETGLPPEVLLPLIGQTAAKIRKVTPAEAQTGPAVRKDLKVLERHLSMLEGSPELRELYRTISESIIHNSDSKKSL